MTIEEYSVELSEPDFNPDDLVGLIPDENIRDNTKRKRDINILVLIVAIIVLVTMTGFIIASMTY